MKNVSLLIILIVFTVGKNLMAQTTVTRDTTTEARDTCSLAWLSAISSADFNFQVNRFLEIMQNNSKLTAISDYVILVRLFNTFLEKKNTIAFNKDVLHRFSVLFDNRYLNPAIYKLEAQKNCESCDYYSTKFKLRIGISPKGHPFRSSDFYQIKQ